MKTRENPAENFIKTIEELKLENEQLKQQNQWLMEQFRLLRHKQYGTSREQSFVEQMNLFNEMEATADLTTPEPTLTAVKRHYRKRTCLMTDKLPEELPVEVIDHELPEDERICPDCGGELHTLGREIREELRIIPARAVIVRHRLVLQVREASTTDQRKNIINVWYRDHLKREITPLLEKWHKIIGVQVSDWGVKNMKTRWGTCNVKDKRIWLNLQLAKKHPQCLEYVIVHELVHLL